MEVASGRHLRPAGDSAGRRTDPSQYRRQGGGTTWSELSDSGGERIKHIRSIVFRGATETCWPMANSCATSSPFADSPLPPGSPQAVSLAFLPENLLSDMHRKGEKIQRDFATGNASVRPAGPRELSGGSRVAQGRVRAHPSAAPAVPACTGFPCTPMSAVPAPRRDQLGRLKGGHRPLVPPPRNHPTRQPSMGQAPGGRDDAAGKMCFIFPIR